MMSDPAKHGAYLVTIGHGMECHSAWSRSAQDYMTGLGKGGRTFPMREGSTETSTAANITSHPTAGIGAKRRSATPSGKASRATATR
jgi:hypothetical protein